MVNIKKIDDQDIVFINKTLSPKEDREFSDFLRERKKRLTVQSKVRSVAKVTRINKTTPEKVSGKNQAKFISK